MYIYFPHFAWFLQFLPIFKACSLFLEKICGAEAPLLGAGACGGFKLMLPSWRQTQNTDNVGMELDYLHLARQQSQRLQSGMSRGFQIKYLHSINCLVF